MKNLIKFLYHRWFPKQSLLEKMGEPVNIDTLPVAEQNIHYRKCEEYLRDGTMKVIIEGLAAQYLHGIVYSLDNYPITVSPAELERVKITAVEEVLSAMENWASRVPSKEEFDKFNIT